MLLEAKVWLEIAQELRHLLSLVLTLGMECVVVGGVAHREAGRGAGQQILTVTFREIKGCRDDGFFSLRGGRRGWTESIMLLIV